MERIRRCGLVGRSVSLGTGFEVSKDSPHAQFILPMPPDCRSRHELSDVPAAMPFVLVRFFYCCEKTP